MLLTNFVTTAALDTGFSDWSGFSIGWKAINSTAGSLTVQAGVGDDEQALLASTSLQALALSGSILAGIGNGRFLRVRHGS